MSTPVSSSNSSPLAGKVAVVTGGSRGIGAAIAKQLAADGAKVALNYLKVWEIQQTVKSCGQC